MSSGFDNPAQLQAGSSFELPVAKEIADEGDKGPNLRAFHRWGDL